MNFQRNGRRPLMIAGIVAAITLAGPVHAGELPSAETVVAKSIEALGGKKAIDAIETLHVKMTVQAGMSLSIDSNWARTGERFMKQGVGGMVIPVGYNGEIAWSQNPMSGEYQIVSKEQVYKMDRQANMHMRFLLLDEVHKTDLQSLETIEVATFGDRECYKLHFVPKDGQGPGYLYFDKETHLPMGMEAADQRNPANTAAMVLSEWKEIEGVKFFHKATGDAGGQSLNFVVEAVSVNDVDPAIFQPPAEVLAMAGKKPATTRPEGDGPQLSDFTEAQQEEIKDMLASLESMSAEAIEKQVSSLEGAMGFMPADKKKQLEYILAEARKMIEKKKAGS